MKHQVSVAADGRGAGVFRPLEHVQLRGLAPAGARLTLHDGVGQPYATRGVAGQFESEMMVGGVLGYHPAALVDRRGRTLSEAAFRVDAKTHIRTNSGEILLNVVDGGR